MIDPEYGEQPPLDPTLAPVDAAISEAFDFRDEVSRVLASKDGKPIPNKDDGADWPLPTDDDDHGDDDEDDDDIDFEEDLVITVPRYIIGKAKVRLTLEIDRAR